MVVFQWQSKVIDTAPSIPYFAIVFHYKCRTCSRPEYARIICHWTRSK